MDFLLHHLLRSSTERFPDKEALVHENRRLTFRQVAEQTARFAKGLRTAKLGRGARVGVFLKPGVPLVVSLFGVSQAGGVFVPIHHSLMPDQVGHIIGDCEMSVLIVDEESASQLAPILRNSPSLELLVVVGGKPADEIDVSVQTFDQLVRSSPSSHEDLGIGRDLAAILYTSGSTGKPKGVMLSHANVIAGASIVSDYLRITDTDRILAALPFSFDAGLNQLTTAFQQGSTLVLTKFLFGNDIVKMLAKEDITGLAGVPSLWNLLVQPSTRLKEARLPNLRYITNTGGAMPQPVLDKLREALPTTEVFLMYGLTEAFRSTYLPPDQLDARPGSMGKAIPNTEIFVINGDGELCEPGEIGELVHHGPTVSQGYWGHPELTDRVLKPHPFPPPGMAEGVKVCYSGDLVKRDEEGFLYFIGRRDNLIKCSGFRVSPTEVEDVVTRTSPVREAAVIGIPDDMLGQHIKAFVVPQEGYELDPQDVIAECATAIPRHMVPREVEIVDSLPKTPSGKVDYPELRRREAALVS